MSEFVKEIVIPCKFYFKLVDLGTEYMPELTWELVGEATDPNGIFTAVDADDSIRFTCKSKYLRIASVVLDGSDEPVIDGMPYKHFYYLVGIGDTRNPCTTIYHVRFTLSMCIAGHPIIEARNEIMRRNRKSAEWKEADDILEIILSEGRDD